MSEGVAHTANARADALLQLGRASEAAKLASTALAESPDSCELLCTLSRALEAQGRHEGALEAAGRAVVADPERALPQMLVSHSLLSLGRREEAIAPARAAVRMRPSSWAPHSTLSRALAQQQPPSEEAMDEARRAVSLAPDVAAAHFAVGYAAMRLRDIGEAVAAFQRVLALDPDNAPALNNLATLRMKQGRLVDAAGGFRAAAAAQPDLRVAEVNLQRVAFVFLRRLLRVLGPAWAILAILSTVNAPLASVAMAIAGIAVLLFVIVEVLVTDHRLSRPLRSYFRRLPLRNRLIGLQAGFLALALTCSLVLLVPMSHQARSSLVFAGTACMLLADATFLLNARRLRVRRAARE